MPLKTCTDIAQTLMSHIRERLPDIKARLNTLMGQTQQELASYGDMHFSGKEHRV
jgi:dynamin 1-like protein